MALSAIAASALVGRPQTWPAGHSASVMHSCRGPMPTGSAVQGAAVQDVGGVVPFRPTQQTWGAVQAEVVGQVKPASPPPPEDEDVLPSSPVPESVPPPLEDELLLQPRPTAMARPMSDVPKRIFLLCIGKNLSSSGNREAGAQPTLSRA